LNESAVIVFSTFPENHPLSLGCGGRAIPQTVHHCLHHADLILGIGCNFTETAYGMSMPKGKRILHSTFCVIMKRQVAEKC
jgi:acetolactate synthase-1/2/3 large subunit